MRPSHLQELHAKKDTNDGGGGLCPPPLKIHKDSHMVKKTSPSSSSSSSSAASSLAGAASKQPQRHPVIIYTHSPKVIHTHPKDFMALVQKLTGLSRNEDENAATPPPPPPPPPIKVEQSENNSNSNDDNEAPLIFDGSGSNHMNIPWFAPNSSSTDYLCGNNQGGFYGYTDSLFFGSPNSNMRSSITSNSGLEGIDEFSEY